LACRWRGRRHRPLARSQYGSEWRRQHGPCATRWGIAPLGRNSVSSTVPTTTLWELIALRLCTLCGTNDAGFYRCNKVKDGLSSWCKKCFADHTRKRKTSGWKRVDDWAKRNPQAASEKAKRYQRRHPDRFRASQKATREKHREAVRAKNNARDRRLKRQTPPWVDRGALRSFYLEAQRLTRETGVKHHVDHVIPLKNRIVSGLHVPANLAVVPARVNLAKSNQLLHL